MNIKVAAFTVSEKSINITSHQSQVLFYCHNYRKRAKCEPCAQYLICQAFDNNMFSCSVFCDVSKAFEIVRHKDLMFK